MITEDDITAAFGACDEIEYLGSGTFGSTFRIERDDDEFVVKVVHRPDMPAYLWNREIAALSRTDHPNVLSLINHGIAEIQGESLPYFTCEYIDGGTLRAQIDNGRRPESPEDLRSLLTGMLAGIGEIHDLGGLHRDIKPENVGLRSGGWGEPVLLDFGLVRLTDMSAHTTYPAVVGTIPYMAPEQLRFKPARTRSDLFAIGVTVYETATGVHPFGFRAGMTIQDLHDAIASVKPADPSSLSAAFDPVLERVVLRLLSYRGHERLGVQDALAEIGDADAD